jgi:hypothetical protein
MMKKKQRWDAHFAHRQRGAATLLVTLVIVLMVAIVSYMMSQTTTLENRMTSAELRSKQAFHSAQAGLDFALQQIMNGSLEVLNTTCGVVPVDVDADENPVAGTPTFQLLYGRETPVCPSISLGLQTRSFVRSVGRSADGSAVRVLEVAIDLEREWISTPIEETGSGGPTPPIPGGIISKGNATVSGTASVAPCEFEQCKAWAVPGHSWQTQANNQTYMGNLITVGGDVNGGTTGTPNTRIYEGNGQVTQDPALAAMSNDDFFQDALGVTVAEFKESTTPIQPSDPLPNINNNPLIWVDGNYSLGGGEQIGSPDKPVVLVVDGNLTLGGASVIWGVVYVTAGHTVTGNGTSKIVGALVAESNVDMATGNYSVFYNSQIARRPVLGGDTGESGHESGDVLASFDATSWREIFL